MEIPIRSGLSVEGDHDISDLTSALNKAGGPGGAGFNIPDVSQTQNLLFESRLLSYDELKQLENSFSLSGNITAISQLAYLSSLYGMNTDKANLEGITNLSSYFSMRDELSSLNGRYSSYLSDYQDFVYEKTTGSLLNSMG